MTAAADAPYPPKQFKHWCRKSGLRPQFSGRPKYNLFYLNGHGHHWRINCYNNLQIGDPFDTFDRWALCKIDEAPMPQSLSEFQETVQKLLSARQAMSI
jgi:hypothetical protein